MGMLGQQIGPMEDRMSSLRSLGSPGQAMTQVDMARGAVPGRTAPLFQGLDPSELAIYDRLAWGSQMKDQYGSIPALLSTMLMGGGYEATKGLQQAGIPGVSRAAGGLMDFVGSGLGGSNAQHMETDETTSPASLQNLLAMIYGSLR